MAQGRRIVPAVPPLAGLDLDLSTPDGQSKLTELLRSLEDFLQVVRDALDDGTAAGGAANTDLPTTVDGTAEASAGTGITWAAHDHQHDTDVTGTPGAVAATAAQGTSSGLARTNHSHRFTLLTTKGDLAGHNGTDPVRVAVGANGTVLQADSAQTPGVKWTATSGLIVLTAGRLVYTDSGGLLATNAAWLADDSGSGDGVLTGRKTMSGGSTASNFLGLTGTLPTTLTANARAAHISVTGAGSSSFTSAGLGVTFNAGYTGSSSTFGVVVSNANAGTATLASSWTAGTGNSGGYFATSATTAGSTIGVVGTAAGGDISVGLFGITPGTKNGATHIGVMGISNNAGTTPVRVGGYFGLNGSQPTFAESALCADNATTAAPILLCRDGGSPVFTIDDGGNIKLDRTITAGGTTGNQTIHKVSGTVNIAAAGTAVTVTNNLVTTSSIVLAVLRTNDATARIASVVPAAGSFTVNLTAAATAEVSIGWVVLN